MSTYTPKFKQHPLEPQRYAELINKRETQVRDMLRHLDAIKGRTNGYQVDKTYNEHLASYRATMRQIDAMDNDPQLNSISLFPYLNKQP